MCAIKKKRETCVPLKIRERQERNMGFPQEMTLFACLAHCCIFSFWSSAWQRVVA